MKRLALLLVLCLVPITTATAAGPEMKEGQWEFTMTMEMAGMPFAMPPMTNTVCLTEEDRVPQKAEPGQNCTIKDQQVRGNTVTWVMDCKEDGSTMHSEGKITYRGDSFDGTVHTVVDGEMNMTQKMSGRYLGPCK